MLRRPASSDRPRWWHGRGSSAGCSQSVWTPLPRRPSREPPLPRTCASSTTPREKYSLRGKYTKIHRTGKQTCWYSWKSSPLPIMIIVLVKHLRKLTSCTSLAWQSYKLSKHASKMLRVQTARRHTDRLSVSNSEGDGCSTRRYRNTSWIRLYFLKAGTEQQLWWKAANY